MVLQSSQLQHSSFIQKWLIIHSLALGRSCEFHPPSLHWSFRNFNNTVKCIRRTMIDNCKTGTTKTKIKNTVKQQFFLRKQENLPFVFVFWCIIRFWSFVTIRSETRATQTGRLIQKVVHAHVINERILNSSK